MYYCLLITRCINTPPVVLCWTKNSAPSRYNVERIVSPVTKHDFAVVREPSLGLLTKHFTTQTRPLHQPNPNPTSSRSAPSRGCPSSSRPRSPGSRCRRNTRRLSPTRCSRRRRLRLGNQTSGAYRTHPPRPGPDPRSGLRCFRLVET